MNSEMLFQVEFVKEQNMFLCMFTKKLVIVSRIADGEIMYHKGGCIMSALHAPPATLATHFMTRPWRELQLTADTFGNIRDYKLTEATVRVWVSCGKEFSS